LCNECWFIDFASVKTLKTVVHLFITLTRTCFSR